MKVCNTNPTKAKDELRKILENKSIYETTVWIRDHTQYLKMFCGYNESEIDKRLQAIKVFSHLLSENFRDDPIATEEFKEICIACAIDIEANCT